MHGGGGGPLVDNQIENFWGTKKFKQKFFGEVIVVDSRQNFGGGGIRHN